MYKTDLVRAVAKETGLSQRMVAKVLTQTLGSIQASLAAGQSVGLTGFGVFYVSAHPAGAVRHIQTGQLVKVAARRAPAFRAGKVLKRAVRAGVEPHRRSGKPGVLRRLLKG